MAELVLKGTLLKVGSPEVKGKMTIQEIVIEEYHPQYPQTISLQVAKNQLEHASKWKIGAETEVKANVKGRKWTNPQGEDKYFNTIEAYFVKQEQSAKGNAMESARPKETFVASSVDNDSLPF
jgi:hypothetical protein